MKYFAFFALIALAILAMGGASPLLEEKSDGPVLRAVRSPGGHKHQHYSGGRGGR